MKTMAVGPFELVASWVTGGTTGVTVAIGLLRCAVRSGVARPGTFFAERDVTAVLARELTG